MLACLSQSCICMEKIQQDIQVAAPVEKAYELWTDFERFPEFMENIEEVRRTGEGKLHWKANIAGNREEWDADVVALEPNRRVAWRSTSGTNHNAGEVTFEPKGAECLVTVAMEVEPDSKAKEMAMKATGILEERVRQDLHNFKELVERS